MWCLARRKLAIAEQLGSRALKTDAVESVQAVGSHREMSQLLHDDRPRSSEPLVRRYQS